ncbi:MAG: hypothetical protein KDC71_00245 [Acidobacteria bacterium]|nr:hypothetical protein [Acidobacteriota bacterium]
MPDHYDGSFEPNVYRVDQRFLEPGYLPIDTDPASTPSLLCYRVLGPVDGFQIAAEGQPAMGDLAGLIAHLTQNAQTDRQKAEALFRFVVRDIKDWYYPAQGIDLTVEDLNTLIWQFGFGFCYDLGRLQAGLWAEAGLRSRIVGWPQHTLAEVFYDNAWHLYDLQHRSFYRKADGTVASFAEIQADPTLLNQNLDAFGLDPIGYPPEHMKQWYSIANPRFEDSADRANWKNEKRFDLNLRAGEMFELVPGQPLKKYHPPSWHQYYGESTLRKEPPWPVLGRLMYVPSWQNQKPVWQLVTTPNGKPGIALDMNCPFLFTEGWIKVPGLEGFNLVWVNCWGRTQFVGRLVGGNALISPFIEGANQFQIMIELGDEQAVDAFDKTEIHTRLQLSPIGNPQIHAGTTQLPIRFKAGQPHITVWYSANCADLALSEMSIKPRRPRMGEVCTLKFKVKNLGGAPNLPTTLTAFNLTTAFLSEGSRQIGVATVPALKPGRSHTIKLTWRANSDLTWYGKDPLVQNIDAWLDIDRLTADPNRENNRLSQNFRFRSAQP